MSQPTEVVERSQSTPTATIDEALPALEEATPTPANNLVCTPGEPVEIAGKGRQEAAFLPYFGKRPVSGGSVAEDGRFSITLVVGRERPGPHSVTVRLRSGGDVLRELTCDVPVPLTPTPMKGRPAR